MRPPRSRVLLLGLGVVALALTIGPASVAGKGQPLVVNIAQAPATLDPAWGCGLYDIGFTQNFYVRLTQYGSKPAPGGTTQFDPGHIVPYFARSIKISSDGRTYTFKLPSG